MARSWLPPTDSSTISMTLTSTVGNMVWSSATLGLACGVGAVGAAGSVAGAAGAGVVAGEAVSLPALPVALRGGGGEVGTAEAASVDGDVALSEATGELGDFGSGASAFGLVGVAMLR